MKIPAYNYWGTSLINSKRIYVNDLILKWTCPECGSVHEEGNNNEVWLHYGEYPMNFYCNSCDFEPCERMFSLNEIGEDYIDITVSDKYNLKCLKVKTIYEEV
tara:strand:- start:469 stop:777 length:309 start_codon:yes stop_codon:yes gene_type:complete